MLRRFNKGDKLGELEIIDEERNERNETYYRCRCKCGEIFRCRIDSPRLKDNYTCFHVDPYIGKTFGFLTVDSLKERIDHTKIYYNCTCNSPYHEEPVKCIALRKNLLSGDKKSCGCLQMEHTKSLSKNRIKHGGRCRSDKNSIMSKLYEIFVNMKSKCYNPSNLSYHSYGAIGIGVCSEWKDSFETFLNDMRDSYQEGLSLLLIDKSKDFSPSNCVWGKLSDREIYSNSIKTMIDYYDKQCNLKEFADYYNGEIDLKTVSQRLQKGYTLDEAIAIPSDINFRNKNKFLRENKIITCPIQIGDEKPKLPYSVCIDQKYNLTDFIQIVKEEE